MGIRSFGALVALGIVLGPVSIAPTAEAQLCVYLDTVDTCEFLQGETRKTSYIVESGNTNADANVQWQIHALDFPTCGPGCVPTVVEEVTTAIDYGNYNQHWNLIYEGDAECVQITGDYWHSQGWIYLIYDTWTFTGKSSSGTGVRPAWVGGGWIEGRYAVDAESSNQPGCDFNRQFALEAARSTSSSHARATFAKWADEEATSSASFKVGAFATCATGVVTSGGLALGGNVRHVFSGGASPLGFGTSGTFGIEGTTQWKGNEVNYGAQGDVKGCLTPPT